MGPKSKRQKQIEALGRLEAGPDPTGRQPQIGGRVRNGKRRTTDEYHAEVAALRQKVGPLGHSTRGQEI